MISKNSGHIKWICRIRILYHSSNTRDYFAKESSGHVVMPGYCVVKNFTSGYGRERSYNWVGVLTCASVTSYFILSYNEFKFTFTNSKSSIQASAPFVALLLQLNCVSSLKIYLTWEFSGTCKCPCSRELPRIPTRKNFPGIPRNDSWEIPGFSWEISHGWDSKVSA